jgi:hypothetical protein
MLLRTFFAAAYGHEGRRGRGWASNCEAHLDMDIRFINSRRRERHWETGGRRGRQQQQLAVVCACRVMIATAKEFPPSPWSVQPYRVAATSLTSDDSNPTNPQPHTQWAAEERSRTSPEVTDTARTINMPRYPKHVWSPAGGWYAQPANWKANTAVVGLALGSIVGMAWMLSANREYRDKMPERHRFFPSR